MVQALSKYFSFGVKRFFSGIFLSRISGMGRDLAMAYAFGAHPTVAAFMIAFRFSNLLRRFFGEGPLQAAFIPQFEGLRLEDPSKAYTFFRKLTFLLFLVLIGITLMLETTLGSVLSLGILSANNHEIVSLTVWVLPCLIFICLYGLNISLLQCLDVFFIPSVAPFLCNLVWIGGALYLKGMLPGEAMPHLVKWVILGFVLQWLLSMILTIKYVKGSFKDWIEKRFYRPQKEVKKLAKSFSLGALGVGAVQINAFLDSIFARYADLSGPVYLWYSIRFQQLALAIFGIAAINTLVPVLSRAIKGGEIEKGKEVFAFGCRRLLTVMIPCTLAIFALGFSAINLVFGQGNFSADAVQKTSLCLSAYGLGLLPTTLVMLYSAVLYAEGNFRTSTIYSVITVGINVGLNSLFVFSFKLGPISTALATSLGAWCNYMLLRRVLLEKGWKSGISLSAFSHIFFAGGIAALLASLVTGFTPSKGLNFIFPMLVFIGGLFIYALIFRNEDLKNLFREYLTRSKGKHLPTRS